LTIRLQEVPVLKVRTATSFLAFTIILAACGGSDDGAGDASSAADIAPAIESITAADLMRHIQRLASDEFEGRAPASPGEDSTVAYLTSEFQRIGLQPGNPDGTFIQNVPLVGFTAEVDASLMVNGQPVSFEGPRDFIADTRRATEVVTVESSQFVFVGYGVVAPEYDWDDYKDVDVTGKTILMLVNDPQIPDPSAPDALDASTFNGTAMTYYGRWTYKYEIAAEKGAAAALVIHETGPAGYPFEVLSNGWGSEAFDVQSTDGGMGNVAVQGWLRDTFVRQLLESTGHSFDELKQQALSRDFRPIELPAQASFTVRNTMRNVDSRNVIARLDGSDPELRDEYVIYTAHWDHLGRDPTREGDQIFNGALDNATGTAGVLELAEAFSLLDPAPRRSILFLAVTAEEKGLLGAKYYAENPLYPLPRTAANINIDGLNQWGRTSDIVVVGLGNSTLDDLLREAASAEGRTVAPDPESEKGFFYRSDHFEFARQGVPALYTDPGVAYVDKPAGFGEQKRDEYTANDYHAVSDEIKPDWDLSGAAADLALLFRVGLNVAQSAAFPEWMPGTEFKATRDAMMRGAGN
jgi:Zn-dependent M28 family amino/carboxypeptidase